MTAIKATTIRTLPQLIETVKALHAKATKAEGKAHDLWITLGIELREAKECNKEFGDLTWSEFAKKHFNFGQSRADELIRIADGRTTVEQVRADTAERVQKHAKAKPALANADSSKAGKPVDDDEPDKDTPYSRRRAREQKKQMAAMVEGWIAAGELSDKQIADYHECGIMPPWRITSACGMVLMEHKPDEAEPDIEPARTPPSEQVLKFCRQPQEFIADYNHRFQVWMLDNPNPRESDKEALIFSLQFCADGMSQLAQRLRSDDKSQIDAAIKIAADRAEVKSIKSIGNIAVKTAADRAEAKSRAHA